MSKHAWFRAHTASIVFAAVIGIVLAAGCCAPSGEVSEHPELSFPSLSNKESNAPQAAENASVVNNTMPGNVSAEQPRSYVPLSWNIDETQLVEHQGTTPYWGSCGECCIANTLNLVTGSAYTEEDIVNCVVSHKFCDPCTGGMTLDDMANAYSELLPIDSMDVHGYGGDYAPTIDDMAARLDNGIILNVSVYGEMMRNGGHVGEGKLNGTHWIVVHSVNRTADGDVAGFGIIDSASSISYLTAKELSDCYYGHDGTTIVDPCCVQVFGWQAQP